MSKDLSRRTFLKDLGIGLAAATSIGSLANITFAQSNVGIEEIDWGDTVEEVEERVLSGPYELPSNWEKAVEGVDKIRAFNYGSLDPWDPATLEAGRIFEEKTGVEVEYLAVPRLQMRPKEVSMLSARSDAVDILQADFSLIKDYQAANWLADLTPLFPEGTWDHYTPGTKNLCKIDGQTWAVSQFGRVRLFLYNKEIFSEAGLDPENPPRDWNELNEAIKKLDETMPSGQNPYLSAFSGEEPPQIAWTSSLYQAGGRVIQPDGMVQYNTEEGIQAQRHWTEMIEEGLLPNRVFSLTEGGMSDSFNAGEVGCMSMMSFAVPRAIEAFGKEKIGVATEPGAPTQGGENATMLDSDQVAVNPFGNKKAAAALYADFIRSYEHQKNEIVIEGNISHLPKVFEDPEVKEKLPFYDTYREAMEKGFLESHRMQQTTYHYIAQYVVNGMKGQHSPEEAMNKLQDQVDQLLGY